MSELAATLPGDQLVPGPAVHTTLAVPVEAAPEAVWPWLVQIGQGRGGMYSYDWLENLIGLDIHSADEIREEWQHLAPGDRVVVVPEGYGPMPRGTPSRWRRCSPGGHSYCARRRRSTRGTRCGPSPRPGRSRPLPVDLPLGGATAPRSRAAPGDPGDGAGPLVMTWRMLRGIKERAERRVAAGAPVPAGAALR